MNKYPFAKLLLLFTLSSLSAYGNEPPAVEARLSVSNPSPYLKETFTLTLEIITRDIDISSRPDLANLPDRNIMRILGSFEALAVQRERDGDYEVTRRRYRAQARPMQSTRISLQPVVRLTSRRRIRSFFGSTIEERPVTIRVPEVIIDVQPLPSAPENFSGVIGKFDIDISAEPLEIQAGDLVTVKTILQGDGWIPENAIPTIGASPQLRAYRVRPTTDQDSRRRHVFSQTVVPMDERVQDIPALSFVWFNTQTGEYQTDTFGPFALQYVDKKNDSHLEAGEELTEQDLIPGSRGLRRSRVQLSDAARAYLAPATTSKSTFTIPPTATIRILETHANWLLINYDGNRGWIPASSLAP